MHGVATRINRTITTRSSRHEYQLTTIIKCTIVQLTGCTAPIVIPWLTVAVSNKPSSVMTLGSTGLWLWPWNLTLFKIKKSFNYTNHYATTFSISPILPPGLCEKTSFGGALSAAEALEEASLPASCREDKPTWPSPQVFLRPLTVWCTCSPVLTYENADCSLALRCKTLHRQRTMTLHSSKGHRRSALKMPVPCPPNASYKPS